MVVKTTESKYNPQAVEKLIEASRKIFTANGMCGCGIGTYRVKHYSTCWLHSHYFEELRQALLSLDPPVPLEKQLRNKGAKTLPGFE